MWDKALGINTCVWVLLGIYLVYSTGTLFLHGDVHQFLFAALLWGLSNLSGVIFATQA